VRAQCDSDVTLAATLATPFAQHTAGMHWVDVVTADYDAEEKRRIRELNPLCNERVG